MRMRMQTHWLILLPTWRVKNKSLDFHAWPGPYLKTLRPQVGTNLNPHGHGNLIRSSETLNYALQLYFLTINNETLKIAYGDSPIVLGSRECTIFFQVKKWQEIFCWSESRHHKLTLWNHIRTVYRYIDLPVIVVNMIWGRGFATFSKPAFFKSFPCISFINHLDALPLRGIKWQLIIEVFLD